MSALPTRPEIPIQIVTEDDVRKSIRRAKSSLERAAAEVLWQVERQAWRTLGYPTWAAMVAAEYGGAAVMLPTKVRPEVVARMKAITVGTTARGGDKHLTDQEVADTFGVSRRQVQDDLRENNGSRTSAQNVSTEPDVIDAEVVEDDEPPPFDPTTGEVLDAGQKATDSAPAEPVIADTCPTCGGTGKVTR